MYKIDKHLMGTENQTQTESLNLIETQTETKMHRVKITDKTSLTNNTQAISQIKTVAVEKVERTETEEEM